MVKSDRLLALLLLLQVRGSASASYLAQELEVSERTIYRDMDALSAAGVPVYTERGRNGGCRLMEGYRTDASGLTADEARALFVFAGRGALTDLGWEGDVRAALRKLLAALPAPQRPDAEVARDRVIIDSHRWRDPPEPVPWLVFIQRALWSDKRLALRYRSTGAPTATERIVDPLGLVVKAGVWYLVAAGEGDPRLYRVSRVEGATVLDEACQRPPDLDLESLWKQLQDSAARRHDAVIVTATVDARITDRLLRMSRSSLTAPVDRRPDPSRPGWNVLRMAWVSAGAAQGILLGLGASVEVLSPASVRTSIAAEANCVVELYSRRVGGDPPEEDPLHESGKTKSFPSPIELLASYSPYTSLEAPGSAAGGLGRSCH